MTWQFWAIFWGWLASAVILICVGLYPVGPVGRVMIGLGILDLLAFLAAAIWFANAMNSDI